MPAASPATAATWRTRALEPTRMPASAEMRGGMSVIESPMYTAGSTGRSRWAVQEYEGKAS
jgi:hypothetical protein